MVSYIALYRGPSLDRIELVGVTSDPETVAHVAAVLLAEQSRGPRASDPAVRALQRGKRRALQLVREEASGAGTRGEVDS